MKLQPHLAITLSVIMLLSACSSGDSSSSNANLSSAPSTPTSGGASGVAIASVASNDTRPPVTTSVANADDLSAYAQVTVGVLKISALSSSGAEVVLFESNLPVSKDLASLASVRAFISTLRIPAGVTGPVTVTLADEVRLLTKSGSTVDARISGDGSPATVTLSGDVVSQPADMLVALNLSQYSYDATTGRVLPLSDKMNLAAMRNATAAAQARMPEVEGGAR